jgi:signal transduction histidine kinase
VKLLQKTNRTYFIISASAFTVAGLVIYIVISFFFEGQLNEKLLSDRMTVIRNIENDGSVPDFYPFVEIKSVPGVIERSVEYSDTLIYDINESEYTPFRQVSSIVAIRGNMYLIIVRDTLLEKSDMLMIIGLTIGIIFVLLNFSLYLINKKLSLKIWQPFYTTLNDIKRFSHDDPDFKLSSVSEIEEFIELNRTLEKLTFKVTSDYKSLKRFTEDASHEIQSPLSIIQSKLETMMQNPELNIDQAELIKSAYASVQRISKLTQTLILLTKIANYQFPEKNKVNLSLLLEETTTLFEDLITGKCLTIEKEIEPERFIETNTFLAESLVVNLVGNAVKHTLTGGMVKITLNVSNLEISNSGIPFTVPSFKIFERFFKINTSSESQGLGLSIVKEICSLNNWEIIYKYEDNLHKFIVRF